jgi:hypothetical protein
MSNHGVSVVTGQALSAPSGRATEQREHVCGNCRNPWSKEGREDCKNNQKNLAKEQG